MIIIYTYSKHFQLQIMYYQSLVHSTYFWHSHACGKFMHAGLMLQYEVLPEFPSHGAVTQVVWASHVTATTGATKVKERVVCVKN
jgi:hypothetical protein